MGSMFKAVAITGPNLTELAGLSGHEPVDEAELP
jgi:hypothetical protein